MEEKALVLLKAAVSVALVWYIVSKHDLTVVLQHIAAMNVGWLALALVAMACHLLACFWRWQMAIGALGAWLSLRPIIPIYYSAMFLNTFLPGTVGGDVFRMWAAARQGIAVRAAVNSVLLERIAAVLAFLVLISITTPIAIKYFDNPILVLAFICATLMAIMALVAVSALHKFAMPWSRFRPVGAVVSFGEDLGRAFGVPRHCMLILGPTIIGHLASALCIYALTRGIGANPPFFGCIVLSFPVLLLAGLPISLAGWGVREGSMIVAFALLGVSADVALATSFLVGVLTLLVSLPGAIVWLRRRERRLPWGRSREAIVFPEHEKKRSSST